MTTTSDALEICKKIPGTPSCNQLPPWEGTTVSAGGETGAGVSSENGADTPALLLPVTVPWLMGFSQLLLSPRPLCSTRREGGPCSPIRCVPQMLCLSLLQPAPPAATSAEMYWSQHLTPHGVRSHGPWAFCCLSAAHPHPKYTPTLCTRAPLGKGSMHK